MRVGIIDYGVGNVAALTHALQAAGAEVICADITDAAHAFVLPGVGHFGHCARELRRSAFDELIRTTTLPVLGICVGMQLFYEGSDESDEPGLSLLAGRVRKLPRPHVGWDDVDGFGKMYFTHQYGDCWMVRERNLTGVQFHPEKSGQAGLAFLRQWVSAL